MAHSQKGIIPIFYGRHSHCYHTTIENVFWDVHKSAKYSTHFETITSEHSKLGIILCPRLGLDQLVKNVIE